MYLFQTARRFDMEIQPSLVLLQKTLLHIEGLGRQLYPELDLWANAKPFLEQWVSERYSARGILERLQKRAPHWLEQLPQRPELLLEALPLMRRNAPSLPSREARAEHTRGFRGWRGWQLLIAAAGVVLVNPDLGPHAVAEWHPATWVFAALALHALLAGRMRE